jgi:hypothetical protein
VRQLLGSDPPRHAVVTGTLRLPLDDLFPGFAAEDPAAALAANTALIRDIRFHPERHLGANEPQEVRDLLAAKRRWIDTHPTATLARRRCHEIRAINERLAAGLVDLTATASARTGELADAMRARGVLASREIAWCFFPENMLKTFLLLETGHPPT